MEVKLARKGRGQGPAGPAVKKSIDDDRGGQSQARKTISINKIEAVSESESSGGWDPFEIWRTRIKRS